jgi:hypothetical protein
MKKNRATSEVTRFPETLEDLVNVGPSIAGDLRLIGINRPEDLKGKDPYELYERLCRRTRQRHDPCVIDTFIAITRFADGDKEKPWWKFTAERKRTLKKRSD